MLDPVDVLVGIQAHVRRHAGEERVGTGVQRGHRDRPSLEVADRSDTIGAQQFEAADVLASQDDDRVSCLDSQDHRRREVPTDISLARSERLLDPDGPCCRSVLHVGETLGPEQLFGHPLRAPAGAGDAGNSESRRLGRRLGSGQFGSKSGEARCPRQRQTTQELPSADHRFGSFFSSSHNDLLGSRIIRARLA